MQVSRSIRFGVYLIPTTGARNAETNAADRNAVISFRRAADGSLRESGRVSSGGRGTGSRHTLADKEVSGGGEANAVAQTETSCTY